MADLELVGGTATMPLGELVACVDRELRMRAQVYPRWVQQGKLTPAKAGREQALMQAVRERLMRAEAEHLVLTGLAGKQGIAHRHLQDMVEEAEKLIASQLGGAS